MNKRNAKIIGIITVTSYIANYFLRNLLSVLTPSILAATSYTKEYIALLSSAYMISYAGGQLVNGILGDIIKPKFMVLIGLSAAGLATAIFPFVGGKIIQVLCFLILGCSLSMLRGPLMKIITENTSTDHARIICVFFSFSSFAGPLIASLLAMIFKWNAAFVAAGLLTVCVGMGAYSAISMLEKRSIISYRLIEKVTFGGLLNVFKIESIAFYLIIASLSEIFGTSCAFWMPTFLNEYVSLDENTSNLIFSFISLVSAIMPFIAFAIYKIFNENDILILKIAFLVASVSFFGMLIVPKGIITVILLLITRCLNSFVSAILWSIYIPSLGKTGRVSSINGIMDCIGYISAGIATTIFAYIIAAFGWNGLIITWGIVTFVGVMVTIGKKAIAK